MWDLWSVTSMKLVFSLRHCCFLLESYINIDYYSIFYKFCCIFLANVCLEMSWIKDENNKWKNMENKEKKELYTHMINANFIVFSYQWSESFALVFVATLKYEMLNHEDLSEYFAKLAAKANWTFLSEYFFSICRLHNDS